MSTPIADMVAEMVAKGAPLEAVVPAIRALELSRTSPGNVPDTPQEYERKRKAAWRANTSKSNRLPKANDVGTSSSSVPELSGTQGDIRCDLTSLSKSIAVVGSKKEGVARARGSRITEDWQPDDEPREFARSLGLDPAALRDEFVDFWIAVPGSRGLKLDWQKTYKNRAREIAGRRAGRTNGVHAPRPGSREDTRERTVNALRSLDPFAHTDEPGPGEGVGAPVPRQLSFVKPA
jgi:hypothetical protein